MRAKNSTFPIMVLCLLASATAQAQSHLPRANVIMASLDEPASLPLKSPSAAGDNQSSPSEDERRQQAVWNRIAERARISPAPLTHRVAHFQIQARVNARPFEIGADSLEELERSCLASMRREGHREIQTLRANGRRLLHRTNRPRSRASERLSIRPRQACSILLLNLVPSQGLATTPTFSGSVNSIPFRIEAHANQAADRLARHLARALGASRVHEMSLQGEPISLAHSLFAEDASRRLRRAMNAMGGPRRPSVAYAVSGSVQGTPYSFTGSPEAIFSSCMRFIGSEVSGPIHRAIVGRRPLVSAEPLRVHQVCSFVSGRSPHASL